MRVTRGLNHCSKKGFKDGCFDLGCKVRGATKMKSLSLNMTMKSSRPELMGPAVCLRNVIYI